MRFHITFDEGCEDTFSELWEVETLNQLVKLLSVEERRIVSIRQVSRVDGREIVGLDEDVSISEEVE